MTTPEDYSQLQCFCLILRSVETCFAVLWFSFLFYLSQINLPHGHDLKTLVDRAFARLDINPANGIVTETEYDAIIARDDADSNYSFIF